MSILELIGLYATIGAILAAADAVWASRRFPRWPWAAEDALAWVLIWPAVLATILVTAFVLALRAIRRPRTLRR